MTRTQSHPFQCLEWAHFFRWGTCGVFECRSRDVRPAAQSLSLVSPRESNQREGDPAGCDPFASLRGDLGRGACGVRRRTRCVHFVHCAQTTAASQTTRQVLPHAAHLPTPQTPRPRHIQKGLGTTRAIAALGLQKDEPPRDWLSLPLPLGEGGGEGAGRWMRRVVPRLHALTPTLSQREREKTPEGQGCAAALLTPVPSVCAEERSGWRIRARVV